MTKTMGCLVSVVALIAFSKLVDWQVRGAAEADKKRIADSVAALPPAQRAAHDSVERAEQAKRTYRDGIVNAKVDETGLLRPGHYICPSAYALSEANRLWSNDREAAAKFAGDRDCQISRAGREVVVDELVRAGLRRVHYKGNPQPWYIDSDGVASLRSSDVDSLRAKVRRR